MATCGWSSGYQLPVCILGQAGVQRLFIAPHSASTLSSATLNVDGQISKFSATSKFYAFDLIQETASFNTTVPTNIQNASQYYESVVNLVIANSTPAIRNQLLALMAGPVDIIVETRINGDGYTAVNPGEGDLYYVGGTLGCWTTAAKFDVGKAAGDFRGWEITMTAKEPVPPYFVTGTTCFNYSY